MATEKDPASFPKRRIQRLSRPIVKFMHVQSSSGILLGLCTLVALVAANTSLSEPYLSFWNREFSVGTEDAMLSYPLWYWINDGLMAIFFFVIGLEVKRELTTGELREPRRVVLPVAAALGGAAFPIAIFLALESSAEARRAWAVPMATDIAFVMGCLALLGERVPRGLTVLLLSIAIVDDVLGVTVIALFYTEALKLDWGLAALLGVGLTVMLNRLQVRNIGVYLVVGAITWLCTLKTGIHPTIAGVVFGVLTPASAWIDEAGFLRIAQETVQTLREPADKLDADDRRGKLSDLSFATREAVSPLVRLDHMLHPWVAFLIMPVFALANAGVSVSGEQLGSSIAIAIAVGLSVGKPLGIALVAFVLVKLGLARLPDRVGWLSVVGGGCLSGIGFTMALFIASLAIEEPLLSQAKVGILAGSAASGVLGMVVLSVSLRSGGR